MKIIFLTFVLGLSLSANSQVVKNTAGGTKSDSENKPSVSFINTASNSEMVNQFHSTPLNPNILVELENTVHNTLYVQTDLLNRPSIVQELMSLPKNERIKAQELLGQLENILLITNIPTNDTLVQAQPRIGNNDLTIALIGKVRELNELLAQNNQRIENTRVAVPGMNGDITDPSLTRKKFEEMRNESEKQVQSEMAKYKNALMGRIIKEEYYGLINEPVQEGSNIDGGILKLAKLKALREILQDHLSKLPQPVSANAVNADQIKNKPMDFSMMQQLDSKIIEEEQHFRMATERRLEMESIRVQQNQN